MVVVFAQGIYFYRDHNSYLIEKDLQDSPKSRKSYWDMVDTLHTKLFKE